MRRFFILSFALFIALGLSVAAPAATDSRGGRPLPDEAERIYSAYGDAIYQIQVIDLASDKKSAIGSGFQFSADGLIATNYHVIAGALQRPAENRLEFLHDRGEKGPLKILVADAVHDLAILQMEKPGAKFLSLGTSRLPKGARLFSLGNPHDIGFTIVEGTFNGLSRESFIDKIHFSGALNPGMSGGPALGHDGRVVGVNVATAGNQIGFLVPVEPLQELLKSYQQDKNAEKDNAGDFTQNAAARLQKQLLKSQDEKMRRLLQQKWESVSFGGMSLPGRIDPVFKCWGAAAHQDKDPYTFYRSTCSNQENIYLDDDFTTGTYVYRYDVVRARPGLNLMRFYNFYEQQYDTPLDEYDNAGEEDTENFKCRSRFVDTAGARWKSAFCIRQYKKYPDLYDTHLYMAKLGGGTEGLLISMAAQGVSKDNALALTEKFISEIRPGSKPDTEPPAGHADQPAPQENDAATAEGQP